MRRLSRRRLFDDSRRRQGQLGGRVRRRRQRLDGRGNRRGQRFDLDCRQQHLRWLLRRGHALDQQRRQRQQQQRLDCQRTRLAGHGCPRRCRFHLERQQRAFHRRQFRGGNATLSIAHGAALKCATGNIACAANSTGTVTVDGAGSTWTDSGNLDVGNQGGGTLAISGGGHVNCATGCIGDARGATGAVTVSGTGSLLTGGNTLYLGGHISSDFGNGTLSITGGGSASTNSLWVGNYGGGTFSVAAAGSMSSASACVGFFNNATGVVNVQGTGSTWTNSGRLNVGYQGNGTLAVTDGGRLASGIAYLGYYGRNGTAVVSGSGSSWTDTSSLNIGCYGTGMLSVAGGGIVKATSVSLTSFSLLAIDVARSSSLTVGAGNGTFTTTALSASWSERACRQMPQPNTRPSPPEPGTAPALSSHRRNVEHLRPKYVYRFYRRTRARPARRFRSTWHLSSGRWLTTTDPAGRTGKSGRVSWRREARRTLRSRPQP